MKTKNGFSLLEVLAVIAIIAILGAMAAPSLLYKMVKDQIESSIPLTAFVKKPVEAAWASNQDLPPNNLSAGLPVPEKIVGTYVSAVTVDNGAIHITFGNSASNAIQKKILTLRPAVIEDAHIVPVTWVCAGSAVPDKMTVKGEDKTTLPPEYLPLACRKRTK